jgi:hypothetical protein
MNWLHESTPRPQQVRKASNAVAAKFQPTVEHLEDRLAPTASVISSTFNGTAIAAGNSIWFNSNVKVSGMGDSPATIHVTGGTITSSAFTIAVPDAEITFSASATSASTDFDAATNTWRTTVPLGFSGNIFLTGAVMPLAQTLPGGVKPVVWSGDFTSDTPGLKVNWKWSAAAYTAISTDYDALGVKPIDGSSANPYANSDHAGTPENFKRSVIGGGRGGGGSNFTGSWSSTQAIFPGAIAPETESSLSGYVYLDANGNGIKEDTEAGIGGVLITLVGTDNDGNAVSFTFETTTDGFYQFTGLKPGTYAIGEEQPLGFQDGIDTIGSLGGSVDNDLFFDISLGAGVNGTNYNFGEQQTE